MPEASLRQWLRQDPKPSSLVFVDSAGNEKQLPLAIGKRNCWKNAEQTLIVSGAVSVQALDEKGRVLRATNLDAEGDDAAVTEDEEERRTEKALSRHNRELAYILDAHGRRQNEAFEAGARAASSQQDKLVALVEHLTDYYGAAIASIHELNMRYAKIVQEQTPGDPADQALMKLAEAIGPKVIGNIVNGEAKTPPQEKKEK